MTLVWLAAALAVIVAGAVYASWTVRVHTMKSGRLIERHRQRVTADLEGSGDDILSRAAWATSRHAEYQHAMTLSLQRAELATADRLAELLAPMKLEVVA